MQTTMELLEKALTIKTASAWSRDLKLHRMTLISARQRGNLSPAIAGTLADELGEDAQTWIVRAALESERDSACKERMVSKFASWRKRRIPPLPQRRTLGSMCTVQNTLHGRRMQIENKRKSAIRMIALTMQL